MKHWVVTTKDQGFDGLKFEDAAEVPKLGDLDVLVKLHGASLNYRDLLIPKVRHSSSIPVHTCMPALGYDVD